MQPVQHIRRTGRFLATVGTPRTLSPRMRRLTLGAPEFAGIRWPLGCDVALALAGDGRELRRRYTVRGVREGLLTVDAYLHGHGPGSSWAASAAAGVQVEVLGPRGDIELPAADWLLCLTDESGLPATAAVAEQALERGCPVRVLAEIADEREQYPLPAAVDVRWLVRGSRPPGLPTAFQQALRPQRLPAGDGAAMALGESRAVVALRDELQDLGLDRSAIYAKGYWNLNARAGR